jgi:hypothetical protein
VARRRSELGQALPLVALVLVVATVALLLVVRVGETVDDRARARTAADAAALAGAAGGRDQAASIAAANGGSLERWVEHAHEVEVVVVVDTAHATARARRVVG